MSQSLKSPLLGVLVALIVVIGFSLTTMTSASSQIPTEPPGGSEGEVTSERLGGETRFETSVSISQEAFPEGSVDVFLARADEFADALSGSSLTDTGPILLVPQCGEIPQVVLDEIERLSPERVVALGGVDAVCEDVLDQAVEAASADGGSESPSPSETSTASPSPSPSETNPECSGVPILDPCPTESPSPSESPTATETPSATPSAAP